MKLSFEENKTFPFLFYLFYFLLPLINLLVFYLLLIIYCLFENSDLS